MHDRCDDDNNDDEKRSWDTKPLIAGADEMLPFQSVGQDEVV